MTETHKEKMMRKKMERKVPTVSFDDSDTQKLKVYLYDIDKTVRYAVQSIKVGGGVMQRWIDVDGDSTHITPDSDIIMYVGINTPNVNTPPETRNGVTFSVPTGDDNSKYDTCEFYWGVDQDPAPLSIPFNVFMQHNYPHLDNCDLSSSMFADGKLIDTFPMSSSSPVH